MSFLHVGAVNNGRKTVKTSIMGSGRGMNILLGKICFSQLLSYLKRFSCLVLSPKMYKVELRGCPKRLQRLICTDELSWLARPSQEYVINPFVLATVLQTKQMASEADRISTMGNGFFGLFGHPLNNKVVVEE
jgi:hypothetical protein